MKTVSIGVLSGIGDTLWALAKVPAILKLHEADAAEIVIVDGEPRRTKEFAEGFDFVARAEYRKLPTLHDPYVLPEGRYNYIRTRQNYHGLDYWLVPNAPLEHGQRLESWLPQFETDWEIARRYHLPEEDRAYARQLRLEMGPYVVFYLGPESGNTREGHNRGSLWRIEHWVELGRRMRKLGYQVVTVGARYDLSYAEKVLAAARFDRQGWLDYVGQWPIQRTFAVCQQACGVISYQSGIGIFSTYLGTPTAIWWRPDGNSIHSRQKICFDNQMRTAWVPPARLADGSYLGMLYGQQTPEDIAHWLAGLRNPLVKIYTHPRSGTHAFCAAVKQRYYAMYGWQNEMRPSGRVGFQGIEGDNVCWWEPLFGGHVYDPPEDVSRAAYLTRDGRDVLASCYRLAVAQGKQVGTFAEYLRGPHPVSDGERAPEGMSRAKLWHWSTRRWRASGAKLFQYEDLVNHRERELARFGREFGLRTSAGGLIDERLVGYHPGTGGIGSYQQLFSQEDLHFWDRCANEENG